MLYIEVCSMLVRIQPLLALFYSKLKLLVNVYVNATSKVTYSLILVNVL